MSHANKLKTGIIAMYAAILAGGLILGGLGLKEVRAEEAAAVPATESSTPHAPLAQGSGFLAIAITVGLGCIGAGMAVGRVGSAAMGAIVEKPELMGRVLILVGLAEGIAIYGLIFGIMLLRQL